MSPRTAIRIYARSGGSQAGRHTHAGTAEGVPGWAGRRRHQVGLTGAVALVIADNYRSPCGQSQARPAAARQSPRT